MTIEDSQDAKKLTKSSIYIKTIHSIDMELYTELHGCDPNDKELTQTIVLKMQLWNRLKAKIERQAKLVSLAEKKAEMEEKEAQKPRSIVR